MAEETDPVSQTTESLKRVQTFDSSTLVQRDKHGQYAFDGAVAPADRLISLFNQMRLDALTTFPQRELQIVRNNAEKIFGKFQDILDFDQNNTEVVPISDKVKRLVTALDNEYEGVFSELMPLISYATCRTVDLGSIENEARATAESIRGEVDKLVKEVEKQNEEASGILERIRKAAAETGVSQEEIHFANLANKYKNRAFWWLLASAGFGIVILGYSGSLIFWFNASWLTPADNLQAFQLFVGKFAVFAILAFALGISARSFLANLHNEVANRHRQNALATFQTLADAANTPENRDVVLTHAAASVFTPQDSGFTKGESPNTPQLAEIVQRVVRSRPMADAQ